MSIKPSVYALGTQPPTLKPDAGAGAWNSTPAEAQMYVLKALLTGRVDGIPGKVLATYAPLLSLQVFLGGMTVQFLASHFGGDDAVKHLLHYLGNTGNAYTIDFQGMINEVLLAKQTYDLQVETAKKFIETLSPGRHNFTSTTGSLNHYISQGLSRNWFFAVGSYTSWGRGAATVQVFGGKLNYLMEYEYHFFDRYNWDGGKQVQIPLPGYGSLPSLAQDLVNKLPNVANGKLTVTDEFMAKFHRQGLAKEFDMNAMINQTFNWRPTNPFVTYKVRPGDSLSAIAKLYYGDANKWTLIHNANKSAVPNPNLIRPGQEVKIPQ